MTLSGGFARARARRAAPGDSEERPLVLVVDDESAITQSLADQLRRDYRVLTANDAAAGLALLREHDVAVVVADQRMPGMTGADMLARAVRISAETVRVLLTGYADIEAVARAINEGQIYFYMTKPWRDFELSAVLERAVEHRQLRKDREALIERLRTVNAELEERVAARTRELEERNAELAEANRRNSALAREDPLTSLANRRRFDEALAVETSRAAREGTPLSVVMIDLDHFKAVNDEYGHATGDRVLVAVAGALKAEVRPYDVAARVGGEEIVLLLPGVDGDEAVTVAERHRASVAALVVEGLPRGVTASFGVATLGEGEPAESLMERADAALYEAKRTGRDRVVRAVGHEGGDP